MMVMSRRSAGKAGGAAGNDVAMNTENQAVTQVTTLAMFSGRQKGALGRFLVLTRLRHCSAVGLRG
jgi:hypothetical protein